MEDYYKSFYDYRYKDYNLDRSKSINPAGYEFFVHNMDVEYFRYGKPGDYFGRDNILTPIYTKKKLKYDELYFRINPEGLDLIKGNDGKFYTLDNIKSENLLQGYSLKSNDETYFERYNKDIRLFNRNLEIIENRKFFQSLREMFNANISSYFDKSIFTINLPNDTGNYVIKAFKIYCAICGYDVDNHWNEFCIKKHEVKDITKKVKESKDIKFLTSDYENWTKTLELPNVPCLTGYRKKFKLVRSFFNFKDTNKLFLFYGPEATTYIKSYSFLIPMSNKLEKVNWKPISEYFDYNIIKSINLHDYKGKIYSTGIEGLAYIEGEITEWWIRESKKIKIY